MVIVASTAAGATIATSAPAVAAAPDVPATAFVADRCTGSTETDPAVSGPTGFTNLLQVTGVRLDQYNAGDAVTLYNSYGDGEQSYPPLCTVRYVPGEGAVTEWMYCTDITAHTCGDVGPEGQPREGDEDINPHSPVSNNPTLSESDEQLISYLLQHGHRFDGTGSYEWGGVDTALPDGSYNQRGAMQALVWCVSDPQPGNAPSEPSRMQTCADSLTAAERQDILAEMAITGILDLDADAATVLPGSVATVTVTTNVFARPITLTVDPSVSVTLCDPAASASLSGPVLTVDGSGAATTDIDLCVTSAAAQTVDVSARTVYPSADHVGWNQSTGNPGITCQVFAAFVPSDDTRLGATASVVFADASTPAIGTSLVDAVDGDRHLVQAGGSVVDTVSYEHLVPGASYTVSGELYDRATGDATGITGSRAFTASESGAGTVDVTFVIGGSWAGFTLVAFESVSDGADAVVAVHEDLEDAAQTVFIADIGTSLVDAADGDRNVAAAGGSVVDTVSYVHLVPGRAYTVSGELFDKATGDATGITGSRAFTASESGAGTVDVTFVIDGSWAGFTLVAFESVSDAAGVVAVHEDLTDAAQTVVVAPAPSPSGTPTGTPSGTPSGTPTVTVSSSTVPGGGLPATGGPDAMPFAVLGLLVLAAGGVLIGTHRRRALQQ